MTYLALKCLFSIVLKWCNLGSDLGQTCADFEGRYLALKGQGLEPYIAYLSELMPNCISTRRSLTCQVCSPRPMEPLIQRPPTVHS